MNTKEDTDMRLVHAVVGHPASFEILRVLVGSTAHGLVIEGTDDRDEMGISIPPQRYLLGLDHFETWIYRTQAMGIRSGPGDLDLVVHSLQKYARLAVQGNPTIMLPLFSPPEQVLDINWIGQALQAQRHLFISRQAGYRFLGYLDNQRQRVLGQRGQARLPNRPELVERYGYDTKYAGHMMRLAAQGLELMHTGALTLPMPEGVREEILAVRRGEWPLEHVLEVVQVLENDLLQATKDSQLPEQPDLKQVNDFLVWAHNEAWRAG